MAFQQYNHPALVGFQTGAAASDNQFNQMNANMREAMGRYERLITEAARIKSSARTKEDAETADYLIQQAENQAMPYLRKDQMGRTYFSQNPYGVKNSEAYHPQYAALNVQELARNRAYAENRPFEQANQLPNFTGVIAANQKNAQQMAKRLQWMKTQGYKENHPQFQKEMGWLNYYNKVADYYNAKGNNAALTNKNALQGTIDYVTGKPVAYKQEPRIGPAQFAPSEKFNLPVGAFEMEHNMVPTAPTAMPTYDYSEPNPWNEYYNQPGKVVEEETPPPSIIQQLTTPVW